MSAVVFDAANKCKNRFPQENPLPNNKLSDLLQRSAQKIINWDLNYAIHDRNLSIGKCHHIPLQSFNNQCKRIYKMKAFKSTANISSLLLLLVDVSNFDNYTLIIYCIRK